MGQPLCLAIELPSRTYFIKADDKETLRGWKKVCGLGLAVCMCVYTCWAVTSSGLRCIRRGA